MMPVDCFCTTRSYTVAHLLPLLSWACRTSIFFPPVFVFFLILLVVSTCLIFRANSSFSYYADTDCPFQINCGCLSLQYTLHQLSQWLSSMKQSPERRCSSQGLWQELCQLWQLMFMCLQRRCLGLLLQSPIACSVQDQ